MIVENSEATEKELVIRGWVVFSASRSAMQFLALCASRVEVGGGRAWCFLAKATLQLLRDPGPNGAFLAVVCGSQAATTRGCRVPLAAWGIVFPQLWGW